MEKGDSKILVSIICSTYNHEQYIRQCLEGFVMQRTTFAFEVLIHDDASTDKTADIIKEYELQFPELIKPIYQIENQYSQNIDIFGTIQLPRARGKYIALCEGDDYWIDPLKLQKQVDFLDKNPEYGLVHSNFKVYKELDGTFLNNGSSRYKICNGNVLAELFRGCWIKTLTVCFRITVIKDFPELPKGAFKGDIALFYEIAAKSKIYFFKEEMGVYRVLRESASHFQEETSRKDFADSLRITDYFALEHYNQTHLKEMVDLKWVISDIKYSLRAGNYKYFKSIKNINALRINKKYFLFLICMICRFKPFFYTLSFLIREKNVLNNKFNKRAF